MMERVLVEYVLNALWQVPLLAGSAWLLLKMVKPSPGTQHSVWLAVLGLALLLPLHGMGSGEISASPQAEMLIEASHEETTGPLAQNEMPLKHESWLAFASLFTTRTGRLRLSERTAHWLLRLYVATVVIGLFRITRAWLAARTLVQHSQEISLADRDRAALDDYSHRLRIKPPNLRESGEVSSPMIVGWRTPILLLPEGFNRHTENEIRAALCHELAHIQRRDYLVNMACQVAALPLAWHPAVDWIQQRIHMTREMVCDAMAAQEMKSHLGYAKCLLALAHSMLGGRGLSAQGQFLGLFGNHTLEERIMRLMETTKMSVRAKATRVVSGTAMMIATGLIAGIFHVTPTMAEADALPQATQNPAADAQPPAPEASSPTAAKHQDAATVTPRKRATIHRNGRDAEQQKPALTGEPGIDAEVQQRMEDLGRQMAEATAQVNTPEFKQRMAAAQRQMEEATAEANSPEFRQRMDNLARQMAEAKVNSPAFKQRMDELGRQMAETTAKFNSPESRQRMDELTRQMAEASAKFNSPESKQRMDELTRQMAEATAKSNSPESRQKMDELTRQMAEATAKFNSPESKQRMDELARQMAEATAKFNSAEFKQKMEDAQRQMAEAMAKFNSPEFKQRMDDLQKQMQQQVEELHRRSSNSSNP